MVQAATGRQWNDTDVGWHGEVRRGVPSRLIQQQRRVSARRDFGRDRGELEVHCLGVAPWEDQADRFSLRRTDGTEDVGRCGGEVPGSRGPRATPCPAARDLVLLAETRFVAEPDGVDGPSGINGATVRVVKTARREAPL